MNKELIDRELLEKWADKLEGADSAGYGWEDLLAAEIRGAFAQPAEAEGSDVVAWAHPDYCDVITDSQIRAIEWERLGLSPVPLVRQSDHLAALSAVTAERDRLREALGDKALCAAYAERQKLLAEVEALRKAPAGWAKMDPAFVVEHIRETTVFDADMIEAMLEFAIGAAMAAKEA